MAQPFRFRLDRVRDVRAREEETAREAFAGALDARRRGEAALQDVQDRVRAAQAAGRALAASGPARPALGGGDLVARQLWMQRLEASVREAGDELARRDGVLTQRRGELVQAGRRREALDRLRDRREAEHRLRETRREAAELDELALLGRRPA